MRALMVACVMLLVALLPGAGAAQNPQGPDYAAWDSFRARAEELLAREGVSTAVLETLRREAAAWRDRFDAARKAARPDGIEALRKELEALGPPPEDGTPEPAEIAERRAELIRRIAELEAPYRKADAAFQAADALVQRIDARIRELSARALFTPGPSPLLPANWARLWVETQDALRALLAETIRAYGQARASGELARNFPLTLAFLALALLALVAQMLVGRIEERLAVRLGRSTAGERLVRAVVTALRAGAAFLAVVAVTKAAEYSGTLGLRGLLLIDAVVPAAGAVTAAVFLGLRIFGRRLPLEPSMRRAGRLDASLLGVAFALMILVRAGSEIFLGSDEALAVALFLPVLLAAWPLWRLGGHMRVVAAARAEAEVADPLGQGVLRLLALLARITGAGAPLVAAVGYVSAAVWMIEAVILTLGLIAAFVVVRRAVVDLYGTLTGRSDEELRTALTPMLLQLPLVAALIPALALAWGARPSELLELWRRVQEGISIGGTRISFAGVVIFAGVFLAGYWLTRLLQASLRTSVLPRTRLDPGARTAIVSGVGYLGIFLSALIAISAAGFDLTSLALVAGALSVGIGFGLQNVVQNFVAGIILLFERPIKEGDWIAVGGVEGYVRDISVRSTRIQTFDRADVIVPNADLISGVVTNYTLSDKVGRVVIPVGVAYGTDPDRVIEILTEVARSHPRVMAYPPPSVLFRAFGASSLDFELRCYIPDVNERLSLVSELLRTINRRLADEGIEIPFPQRDLWLRTPVRIEAGQDALRQPPAGDEGEGRT